MNRITKWVQDNCQYLPWVIGFLMVVLSLGMLRFAWQWQHLSRRQLAVDHHNITQALNDNDHLLALHQAYQLSKQGLNKDNVKQLMQALTIAEASPDITTRGLGSFISGNLYYDLSKLEQNIANGGAHQQAVAQIELAREAYKRTIRLMPDFYDARFNLELLDRLSPAKRTQGWQGGVDGVTLQPFKRNGTAMMRDNQRRGLP